MATKKTTEQVATKATKVATKKEVDNKKKVSLLTIEEVTKLYEELGIKCENPTAKGNYRIMGGKKGSSLNIKPTKGYYIYTTDEDYANVSTLGIKADDLVFEEGTNTRDKNRPNTVICTELKTLRALLEGYATNVLNRVVAETK